MRVQAVIKEPSVLAKPRGCLRFTLRKNKARFKGECYCSSQAVVSVLLAPPDPLGVPDP